MISKIHWIHVALTAIVLSSTAGLVCIATAARGDESDFKTEFLTLCDSNADTVIQNARDSYQNVRNRDPNRRFGYSFFIDSYAVRALCVAYDLTGKKKYLDACKQWSDQMVEYQNDMIPKEMYYMNYGRPPGQPQGNCYIGDTASIGEAVLATAIRCTDPVEKRRYLDSVQSFANMVVERFVRPSGGVTDGWWPDSDKEWWCSTGIFGALAFELFDETKYPKYLKIGLGTIDWLNRQDLEQIHELKPTQEGNYTLWMYCLEAYSAGFPHFRSDTERYPTALNQWSKARQLVAKNRDNPESVNYLSWWGSKCGGLPFHLYIYASHVTDRDDVIHLADEELRSAYACWKKSPSDAPQRYQLAAFTIFSYAEKVAPGKTFRTSQKNN